MMPAGTFTFMFSGDTTIASDPPNDRGVATESSASATPRGNRTQLSGDPFTR
jgi:hypothetical protein